MIKIERVSVTYPGGVEALKDVDLEIQDGEFVVIVGLSGAGKSTLLRVLNGLVPATSGSIIVDGTEVVNANSQTLRQVRSKTGMIFLRSSSKTLIPVDLFGAGSTSGVLASDNICFNSNLINFFNVFFFNFFSLHF